MVQNRNKLIELFISNISNCIVHKILEKAIEDANIRKHYDKELLLSLKIAKKYREMINPINTNLPKKDIEYIKQKITNKVLAELRARISKGYLNIDLESVEPTVDKMLNETSIIE